MAEVAREHDLALISDEVFADYPISGTQPASALRQQTALTFMLGGLSKSVGLPQVKLGWIAVGGPAPLVADALERLETICDAYLSVSTPVQVAAPDLLKAGAAVRTQIQARVCENWAQLAALASANPACCRDAGRGRMVCRRAGAGDSRPRTRSCSTCSNTRACSCIQATSSISNARRFSSSVCSPKPGNLRLRHRRSSARWARPNDSAFASRGNHRAAVFSPIDPELGYRRNRRYSGVCASGCAPGISRCMQILPLNELAPSESSPYSALSAMAIDPQFISIWMMDDAEAFEREWRVEMERVRQTSKVDYKAVRDAQRPCIEDVVRTVYQGRVGARHGPRRRLSCVHRRGVVVARRVQRISRPARGRR